ncbi:MAG TPA: protein kinase [Pyrinomonadaceae bacterium]|jgi:serine/threonine protein kinase
MTELKLQQCRLDGRYDVLDCLGRGSYAEIYVARDIAAADGEPQTVVIKALNVLLQGVPDAELERTLIENFQNEAVAIDRVRHPNIISRLGHGTAIDLSGTTFHYMVLEYLSGGDMGARCRHQPFPLDRALFYLEQVCSGLAHAHECGVIHRDIKPQNLLLTADGQTVKIADFGVAKIEATEGAITRVGTNIYAAPEHNPLVTTGPLNLSSASMTKSYLTPAADIYSLAKTTYTLLAGEPPRRFSHHPITELPAALAHESWSKSVLRVLRRATATPPEERYQTVQEFWEELADAALPPTQLLKTPDGGARPKITSSLQGKAELLATEAPPRARFETQSVIERKGRIEGNGAARPRIVVPVTLPRPEFQTPPKQQPFQAPPLAHAIAAQPVAAPPVAPYRQVSTQAVGRRGLRALITLLVILAFAGILLATHFYVKSRRALSTATPVNNGPSVIGHQGTTTSRVYLRRDPSMSSTPPLRTVEKGSRVRILSVSDNNFWYEVEILADNDSPDAGLARRGWMGKKNIDLD